MQRLTKCGRQTDRHHQSISFTIWPIPPLSIAKLMINHDRKFKIYLPSQNLVDKASSSYFVLLTSSHRNVRSMLRWYCQMEVWNKYSWSMPSFWTMLLFLQLLCNHLFSYKHRYRFKCLKYMSLCTKYSRFYVSWRVSSLTFIFT